MTRDKHLFIFNSNPTGIGSILKRLILVSAPLIADYTILEGYFWFIGRDDDVINTGGHLVSPFEVESALLEHIAVAESAVTSKPDEINMEVVKAFISLKPGYLPSKDLELQIMNFIRKKLSAIAMPQEIEFVAHLPKTSSGKIMKRLLHAKECGEEIGDVQTLEND